MPAPGEIWYVYGVVRAGFEVARAPGGLDDVAVELCSHRELAALVARLDGEQYAPETLERATEDVEWLAPRAVAHDRVLTWASDHGPVVPLPIFSLFSSATAVQKMLEDRREQLSGALERAGSGREYALRVYRIDAELTKSAADFSPRLAELRDAAASAAPGQRYLLERKLDTERKNELTSISARVSRDVVEALRPLAIDTTQNRIAARGARLGDAPLILDAAFLVAPEMLEQFQRELTDVVGRHAARGFRFDFTGPWPLYHFVQGPSAHSADDA
ncbi:MAG TPA: GvpL/GvpF family gas vesicle protein [Gemmatimonadaceae bacterium]|nr:GvpL/GvpF family gas vesicle protein [Gemmatimonadaceae bacterium]